jgi:hypothetical protein
MFGRYRPEKAGGELGAALRALADADTVAFGPVGFAARTLPATEAYRVVERAGEPARPYLDWLLGHASPAGKVYAATLLDRLDPAAGRAAWQRLTGERAAVQTFSGCIVGRTTVGEYAAAAMT